MEKHILFCAFAEVPGPTSTAARLAQLLSIFPEEGFSVDALTVRGKGKAHIQRLGTARLMRVPVGDGSLVEQFGKYERALGRQLRSEPYDLVVCADLLTASALPPRKKKKIPVLIECGHFLDETIERSAGVDETALAIRGGLDREREVLGMADVILAPSRLMARRISERTDPRRIELLPRAVSLRVFSGTARDGDRVVILGARDRQESERALALARKIHQALPQQHIEIVGAPFDDHPQLSVLDDKSRPLSRRLVENPNELRAALKRAQVVAVMSTPPTYALPHRALEAMAMARPTVVAVDAEGAKDLAVAGDVVVVEPGNLDGVAAHVVRLVQSADARAALRAQVAHKVQAADSRQRAEEFAQVLSRMLQCTVVATEHDLSEEGYSQSSTGHRIPPGTNASPNVVAAIRPERVETPIDVAATGVSAPDLGGLSSPNTDQGDVWAATVVDPRGPAVTGEEPDSNPAPPPNVDLVENLSPDEATERAPIAPGPTATPSSADPDATASNPWSVSLGDQAQKVLAQMGNDEWVNDTVFEARPDFEDDDPPPPVPTPDEPGKRPATGRFLVDASGEGPTLEQAQVPSGSSDVEPRSG